MKVVAFAALVLAAASILSAQANRGTISGSVTYASGGDIAKARITATETRTGVKTTAASESSGAYNLPFLALGEYQIAADAPGFKKFVQQGITLSAGAHPVIDVHLDV